MPKICKHWKNRNIKNIKEEIWKRIVGFGDIHLVSNKGRVKYCYRNEWKIRNQRIGVKKNGKYCFVNICYKSNKYTLKVHRLVASTFIKNPLNKPQVNHINGIKTDNRKINLEWATASENGKHAFSIGLKVPTGENTKIRGSKNVNAKIIEKDVLEIRKLREWGLSCVALAEMYGVNNRNISQITLRRSWKHI